MQSNLLDITRYLTNNITNLEVLFDPIKLKFSFRMLPAGAGTRITLGVKNGPATGTPDAPGEDMNEELGFDFINLLGDPFVELNALGTQWFNGFSNGNPAGAGTGIDTVRNGAFFIAPAYFLYGDDCVDMTNSIRSLFIRTNLSTTSVLDSHIGGGFSNILTRVYSR